jgi:hypothetical protein
MADFNYWKSQILSAKEAAREYWQSAKDCEEVFENKDLNYNIFYSNVCILDATLNNANPRPYIQRRFIKRAEQNKLLSSLYSEVSNILQSAVEYFSDITNVDNVIYDVVHAANITGRGVIWVEYIPEIGQQEVLNPVTREIEIQEFISDRKLICSFVDYEDFLCSSAKSERDIWWVAKRHLLTKKEIKERFNYSTEVEELSHQTKDETEQKRGEVWEIWDKSKKRRIFILTTSLKGEVLEEQEDPYGLDDFFPCVTLTWLTKRKTIQPKPEYFLYQKLANQLEDVVKKSANIEDAIRFIILANVSNSSIAAQITTARDGAVISVPPQSVEARASDIVSALPSDIAVNLVRHFEEKKGLLKQNIYDITGISDLLRGQTDARETAEAQKIKGLFGSLRFNARQMKINKLRRKIYSIFCELIAEHLDVKTLSEITCSQFPEFDPEGGLDWEKIMELMHNDNLRNYTIDVETTATIFDDKKAENAAIQNLMATYLNGIESAIKLNNGALIKGLLPVLKLGLRSVSVSSALERELEASLNEAYSQYEQQQQQQQQPQINPLEVEKVKIEQLKNQTENQVNSSRLQIEKAKISLEQFIKEEELKIKKQEADRKDRELELQKLFKEIEIKNNLSNMSSNLAGDVGTIDTLGRGNGE